MAQPNVQNSRGGWAPLTVGPWKCHLELFSIILTVRLLGVLKGFSYLRKVVRLGAERLL